MQGNTTKTELDRSKRALGQVFEKHFEQFESCAEATGRIIRLKRMSTLANSGPLSFALVVEPAVRPAHGSAISRSDSR
jgi:hypothetical protein